MIADNRLPPISVGRTVRLPLELRAQPPEHDELYSWMDTLIKELQGLPSDAIPGEVLLNATYSVCLMPRAVFICCQQCTTTGRHHQPNEDPILSDAICPSCYHRSIKNAIATQSTLTRQKNIPVHQRSTRADESRQCVDVV